MKTFTRLALGAALAASTSVASAGTISGGTNQIVGAEMSGDGGYRGEEGGYIVVNLATGTRANESLTITLAGADFVADVSDWQVHGSNPDFELGASDADDIDSDDWILITATSDTLSFDASGVLAQNRNNIYFISASNVPASAVYNLSEAAADATVTLSAEHSGADSFALSSTIFTYAAEFSARASGLFNGVIDAIDLGREELVGGASDAMEVSGVLALTDISTALDNADTVTITLAGDMTGIGSVIFTDVNATDYEGTIDVANGRTTIVASGADVFRIGGGTNGLAITPLGTLNDASGVIMAPGDFKLTAVLNLVDEDESYTVINDVNAGELTINGASGRIAQMSLNYGFVQWVKVTNLSAEPATVEVDITANGTTYDPIEIKSIPAQSVGTVSGGEIESALAAAGGPTTPVDASVLFTVPVGPALVNFHSEKKATDGRTITNVE